MRYWLDHVSTLRSPLTVREYALTCQKYLEAVGDHPVTQFRRHHEVSFLQHLKETGLSEHSLAKQLRQLQTFWKWAYEQEYIEKLIRISKVRPTSREPKIYSEEDL